MEIVNSKGNQKFQKSTNYTIFDIKTGTTTTKIIIIIIEK